MIAFFTDRRNVNILPKSDFIKLVCLLEIRLSNTKSNELAHSRKNNNF